MRPGDLVRVGYGLGVLIAPDRVAHALAGSELDDPARMVVRARGAVLAAQGLALLAHDSDGLRRLCLGIDTLHALSMVVLAGVDPDHRRLALTDGAVATALGLEVGITWHGFPRSWLVARGWASS